MALQDVDADEREFKKTQEKDRQRLARTKKVQEGVDRAREQNARRKLDKASPLALGSQPHRLTLMRLSDPKS